MQLYPTKKKCYTTGWTRSHLRFPLLQVFSKADVWFSVDSATYEEEPLSYSYIPDIVLENARNVSIGLHERHGRFVKMHLYFAGRWIMISEVTFDGSKPFIVVTRSFIDHPNHPRQRRHPGSVSINQTKALAYDVCSWSSSLSLSLSLSLLIRFYVIRERSYDHWTVIIKITATFERSLNYHFTDRDVSSKSRWIDNE